MVPGTHRLKFVSLVLALAGVLILATAVVAVTTQKSGGPVKALRAVTVDDGSSIYALTPQNVPGMSVSVTVPSGEQALLLITFSAQTGCQHSLNEAAACMVQVKVGGNVAKPGPVTFAHMEVVDSFDDIIAEANSMQFIAGPLSAGQHTVTVQGWVTKEYTYFALGPRTLTVLRSKV